MLKVRNLAIFVAAFAQALIVDPLSCQTQSFYDTPNYNCQACGANSIQNTTNGQTCICKPGCIKTYSTRFNFEFSCEVCPAGKAPDHTVQVCLPCASIVNGVCACPDTSYQLVDTNADGSQASSITCRQCPAGSYALTSPWTCVSCPSKGMVWDTIRLKCKCTSGWTAAGSDSCVPQLDSNELTNQGYYPAATYNKVTYYSLVGSNGPVAPQSVNSDVFEQFYIASAVGCSDYKNPVQCQALANLCILQLYDERTTACQLLRSIQTEAPPIYYTDAPSTLVSQTVNMTVAFENPLNDPTRTQFLTYQLARYDIEGNFLGFQELKTQLNICSMGYQDILNMKRFGTVTQNDCNYDLINLAKGTNLPKDANAFFELYISDSSKNLINVPVLISNYADSSGAQPNKAFDQQTSRLVKRFFITDTISGIENSDGYKKGEAPKVIRYAKSVMLRVQLDPTVPERIRVPLLYITYEERLVNTITSDTQTSLSYFVDYYADATNATKSLVGIFIAANILVFIIVCVRVYNFVQHNPPLALGLTFKNQFILKSFYYLCDEWSTVMFWVSFFVNGYWFIMYKMQSNAYLLLPSTQGDSNLYSTFNIIFLITLSAKTFAVLFTVCDQGTADIVLIDWERPKKIQIEDKEESVVAWRNNFIANEVNEIQTEHRKIVPETTLIWFVFFWVGIGWGKVAHTNPDFSVINNEMQPINPFLNYFLCAFIILCIAAVQYVLYLLGNVFNDSLISKFTDLCTVSNVSVLIMTEKVHGYYIHGQAPWMRSDLPISWLKAELDKERRGKLGQNTRDFGVQRNQSNDYRNNQVQIQRENVTTFEIYMTARFRKIYDDLKNEKLQIGYEKLEQDDEADKKAEVQQRTSEQLGKERAIKMFEAKRRRINQVFVEQMSKMKDTQDLNNILEHTWCQRLCRRVPDQVEFTTQSEAKTPFWLVKDPFAKYPNFEAVLYMSLDFQLVILYILWFLFFDQYTKNAVLSVFLVYLIEKVIREIRIQLGRRNLVSKTMLDKRFLM